MLTESQLFSSDLFLVMYRRWPSIKTTLGERVVFAGIHQAHTGEHCTRSLLRRRTISIALRQPYNRGHA